MRVKFKGKIESMTKTKDGSSVNLHIGLDGKVIRTNSRAFAEARIAKMECDIVLKPVVADDIKIGSVITVEVNDEESDTRIE